MTYVRTIGKSRRRLWAILGVALVLLLGIGLSAGVLRGAIDVRIESTPAGAAVYVDDQYIGRTPALATDLGFGPHVVVIKHIGFAPHRGVLQARLLASEWAERTRGYLTRRPFLYAAELKSGETGVLVVISRPDEAQVYLDGRLAGMTPMRLDGVAVGEHEVRLAREGYRAEVAPVVVTTGTVTVERQLSSLIIEVMEKRTKTHPGDLHNVIDLAHQYTVTGAPQEALRVLGDGYKMIKGGGVRVEPGQDENPQSRFFSECWKIYCREIKYPAKDSDALRTGVMKLMQQAAKENPSDRTISSLLDRMYQYTGK